MKRRLVITAVTVLVLSLAAYATMAFLTANFTARNVITAGNVKIELLDLTETGDGEKVNFPAEGLMVMPGTTASKEVSVKNLANTSWVRVYLDKKIILGNDNAADAQAVARAVELNLNHEAWILGEDGFYYYNKPLNKDDETANLFTEVRFGESMGNEYQNSKLTIQVYAQAVQAANNETEDATKVKGWPADDRIPTPVVP